MGGISVAAGGRRHLGHRGRDFDGAGAGDGISAGGNRSGADRFGARIPRSHSSERSSRVTPAPVTAAVCTVLILLIPLALAGLALMNCGLGRSRSAAHALMSALTVAAAAAIAYVVFGFAWQGFAGRPAFAVIVAGTPWNWIGADRFFLSGLDFDGSPAA